MMNMLSTALYAGIGASITAAGGYLKSEQQETFSWMKFLRTTTLAMVFSAGASLTGLTSNVLADSALGIAIATVVENWLKAAFRKQSILRKSI